MHRAHHRRGHRRRDVLREPRRRGLPAGARRRALLDEERVPADPRGLAARPAAHAAARIEPLAAPAARAGERERRGAGRRRDRALGGRRRRGHRDDERRATGRERAV